MSKCAWCDGKGWVWIGLSDNAERMLCDLCAGAGDMHIDWLAVTGVVTLLTSSFSILYLFARLINA